MTILDDVLRSVEMLAETWSKETEHRRAVSSVDPVADTLDYVSSELREKVSELRAAKAYLSTEEYAFLNNVSPQTVRRWIKSDQLNAMQLDDGGYRIPRNARRKKAVA